MSDVWLVVLVVGMMWALDDVYLTSVQVGTGENPFLAVTFEAAAVRVV